MKRAGVCLFALAAVASCVLPSVELDPSLGTGNQAAASGASDELDNGGSNNSSSGGKNGSSSGGTSMGAASGTGATGAEGGDDSGSGGGGAATTGGLGGVSGAGAGVGGSLGGSNDGGSGGGSTKNPPDKSAGCDQVATITSGERTIMVDNQERSYTIDIPTDYDSSKPYRVFYASHWIASTDNAVVAEGFYYLKPKAAAADEPAIFVAPQALGSNALWSTNSPIDHRLFEDIVSFVEQNLCVDKSRIFAIGYSFGGMMTYSLSRGQQSKLRAAVGIAPTNFNIYLPPATQEPIAWMQTTGMSDGTNPWVTNESSSYGAKYVAIEHATNNGCSDPTVIPIWEPGMQEGDYLCHDFAGCDADYPTKVCTFNGGHVSTGASGSATSWITDEVWNFFMQF